MNSPFNQAFQLECALRFQLTVPDRVGHFMSKWDLGIYQTRSASEVGHFSIKWDISQAVKSESKLWFRFMERFYFLTKCN